MDLEAFVIAMKRVRNWPREKCLAEWKLMFEDTGKNVPRDNKGPK